MDMSLLSIFLIAIAIIGTVNSANDEESKKSDMKSDKSDTGLDERVQNLEAELQRVKDQLIVVENLLDAWILNGDQHQPRPYSVNEADAAWDAGRTDEKRGWAFMGSRGKRKPFILGSRGKRQAVDELLDEDAIKNEVLKRAGSYFYGSRGKKQYTQIGSTENLRSPFTNKRYTFMGSRGKK